MTEQSTRVADATGVVAWFTWIYVHTTQINEVLQMVLLLASIVASLAAAVYHIAKWRRLK